MTLPPELAYLTPEFIRSDVGVHGAVISDEDVVTIQEEVLRLFQEGKFHHTGVYWIANRLAAENKIHPTLPEL